MIIIKTAEGKKLLLEAEQVKLNILTHQYRDLEGNQVIALDEPIGVLTIEGKDCPHCHRPFLSDRNEKEETCIYCGFTKYIIPDEIKQEVQRRGEKNEVCISESGQSQRCFQSIP